MTDPALPIANPLVVLREEFDDWAVLFDPETSNSVGINPVGVAIWKRLDGRHSLGQISGEIRGLFTEATGQVDEDVATFVRQLADGGFLAGDLK